MIIFLFIAVHILLGLMLISFKGKLPKQITTFSFVFLSMSFLYFGSILLG
ncbi:hypothetical protein JOC33_002866 [Thalassobacillus pellis]|nr:hypothetical protein [Thalassobacillus pellis]